MISTNIVNRIRSNRFQQDYVVKASEVYEMIGHLKANKNEGLCGLSSDFFINGPPELSIHIALLITAMLSHGFSPSLLTVSTIIPIPKGNQVNLSESANYRAITLSSILCKIIDLIVINRYGECLNTSFNQFGFKPKGSTSMCTMLVKETISYYRANSNDVYCVFLHASKALTVYVMINFLIVYSIVIFQLYSLGSYLICILLILLVFYGMEFTQIDFLSKMVLNKEEY